MFTDDARKSGGADVETADARPRYESPKVIPLSQTANGVGLNPCGNGSANVSACGNGNSGPSGASDSVS